MEYVFGTWEYYIFVCDPREFLFVVKLTRFSWQKKPQLINEAIADSVFCFYIFSWKSIHIPQTSELRHKNFKTISVFDKKRWIDKCLKVLKDPPSLKVTKSHKIFHFGLNLQKMVPNHYPEHLLFRWIALRTVQWLALTFWDLSQSEKLSEIK